MQRLLLRFHKILLAALLLTALPFAVPAPARDAEKARIVDLAMEVEDHKVFVSFALEGAVDEKLEQRIASGLATGIVFDFELVRVRKRWFNKNVKTGNLQVIVMYNAVSREYLVNYKHDGDLIESRLIRDLEELYTILTRVERLEVFSLEGLAGEQLQVRARAELGTRSILFFIPSIRATDWSESPRFRVGRNGETEEEAGKGDGKKDEE
jgi:hypothetical protein